MVWETVVSFPSFLVGVIKHSKHFEFDCVRLLNPAIEIKLWHCMQFELVRVFGQVRIGALWLV